ncbi:signal peptidase I [Caloramator quimbayensis]|uniref:Signal peptidase I n=1 Tax=Caloramator quimbayensis TaxID=1147123 RepID=A0A1T4Y5X5_9CLOT|nr:signal peptidase I [Caloramator quimbayensis]SKA96711.1 signal peptidase I [Caloramator quimbayensis]
MDSIKVFVKEWVIPIVIAFIIALAINKFLFFKILVPTESMYPTIKVQDRIFVTRVYHPENLKRGDIVVFYSDELGERLVKRLIGLPGDKIDIKDGTVYINGKKYEEPYVVNKDDYTASEPFVVPDGEYFFLGDNRANSLDSRYWQYSYIKADKIEGKAIFTLFPFNRMGVLK